jgi:hypothetical protein
MCVLKAFNMQSFFSPLMQLILPESNSVLILQHAFCLKPVCVYRSSGNSGGKCLLGALLLGAWHSG